MIKLKVKYLKTFQEKSKGLIGLTKFTPVFFKTRFGIHTYGMKVPIDVLILDRQNKVIKIKKNLKPGRVFFWNPGYFNVVEMPVDYSKVKIGETIFIDS